MSWKSCRWTSWSDRHCRSWLAGSVVRKRQPPAAPAAVAPAAVGRPRRPDACGRGAAAAGWRLVAGRAGPRILREGSAEADSIRLGDPRQPGSSAVRRDLRRGRTRRSELSGEDLPIWRRRRRRPAGRTQRGRAGAGGRHATSPRPATPTACSSEPFDAGLPHEGQWRNGFDIADMNGDGLLDIVHGPPRKGDRRPHVFLGDGKGNWRVVDRGAVSRPWPTIMATSRWRTSTPMASRTSRWASICAAWWCW